MTASRLLYNVITKNGRVLSVGGGVNIKGYGLQSIVGVFLVTF
jgi:hypothetical protein